MVRRLLFMLPLGLALLALAWPLQAQYPAQPVGALPMGADRPLVEHCLVQLISDVQVPAQEAGMLIGMPVDEGAEVKEGDLLAHIDDSEPRNKLLGAQIELEAAQAKAADDIEVRYAEAAYHVADAELAEKLAMNQRIEGTIPRTEIRRLELTKHRAALQIDRSKLDLRVATMTAEVHQAAVKNAQESIARRRIVAPFPGIVVGLSKQRGEWVNPGDAVVRVARMDRLKIEGFVSAGQYNPSELTGKPVVVQVELARGRTVQFGGELVFVSPLVQAGGRYRVRAEVENRAENGHWLLRPGMNANMQVVLR